MMGWHYMQKGFTIIELLIVVVVIAILATITLSTYGGIRERAEATAIISHVRQYVTIFEAYIAENGKAPAADWRCLGDEKNLPAGDGYDLNYCFKPSNGGTNPSDTMPASPELMELLLSVNTSLPRSDFPDALCMQGRTCRGLIYDGSTNNFPNSPAVLVYFTKLQTCPIGDKVAWWTGVDPTKGSGCAYKLSVNQAGVPK